jgi:integral membrane sensor domain MASE1
VNGWRPVAEASAVAGGLLAGAVAVLCLLASGPAGPGRLAETGPTWWLVAMLAGLEVAVVMAPTLFVLRRR